MSNKERPDALAPASIKRRPTSTASAASSSKAISMLSFKDAASTDADDVSMRTVSQQSARTKIFLQGSGLGVL